MEWNSEKQKWNGILRNTKNRNELWETQNGTEKQELQVRAVSWGGVDFVPKNESNHENTNGSAILQGWWKHNTSETQTHQIQRVLYKNPGPKRSTVSSLQVSRIEGMNKQSIHCISIWIVC